MSETKNLNQDWLTLEEVEEFHNTFNHPIGEGIQIPDPKVWKLRCKLILEELDELTQELGVQNEAMLEVALQEKLNEIRSRKVTRESYNPHDLQGINPVAILKEASDLQYVVSGSYIVLGVHPMITKAHTIVHNSNMSKLAVDQDEIIASIEDNIRRGKVDNEEAIVTKATHVGIIIYRKSDMKVLKSVSYKDPNKELTELYNKEVWL